MDVVRLYPNDETTVSSTWGATITHLGTELYMLGDQSHVFLIDIKCTVTVTLEYSVTDSEPNYKESRKIIYGVFERGDVSC